MRILRWLYLVFSSAVIANAQCDGPSITIVSGTEASSISTCETYNGNIIIDPAANGSISLDGIRIITGNLTAVGVDSLTGLIANNLAQIKGTFELGNLPLLEDLEFPILANIGRVRWSALPTLSDFPNNIGISTVGSVYISNTSLRKLSTFNSASTDAVDINNNAYLETVAMNRLVNVSQTLSLQANAPNLYVLFEGLESAGDLTFRNVSGLALPSLSNITGSFACYSCAIAKFWANNVGSTGGNVTFVSTDLQTLHLPQLTTIGGSLQLSNNSYLSQIDGSSSLETIKGSMQLNGVNGNIRSVPGLYEMADSSPESIHKEGLRLATPDDDDDRGLERAVSEKRLG